MKIGKRGKEKTRGQLAELARRDAVQLGLPPLWWTLYEKLGRLPTNAELADEINTRARKGTK